MLSADCGYFGDTGGELMTFLVIHVKPFGAYYACIVDNKGATPKAVRAVADFILHCGLVRFVYRSDKEKAIMNLLEAAIRESGREGIPMPRTPSHPEDVAVDSEVPPPPQPTELAVPEHSHPGESRSNGLAERSVKLVEDQVRTLKSAYEDRLQWKIPANHPLLHWSIHHAAYLITKYHVGTEGMTRYQRLHGKCSMERIAEFGKRIVWFVLVKRRAKLDPRWRNGLLLGRSWNTDQNYIALLDGSIVRARAMVRVIPDIRWDSHRAKRVTGKLFSLHDTSIDQIEESLDPHRGVERRADGPESDDQPEPLHRRLPILQRDLTKYGFTDGCLKCRYLRDGQHLRAQNSNHTEPCRKRIYGAMRRDQDPRIVVADAPGDDGTRVQPPPGKHEPNTSQPRTSASHPDEPPTPLSAEDGLDVEDTSFLMPDLDVDKKQTWRPFRRSTRL